MTHPSPEAAALVESPSLSPAFPRWARGLLFGLVLALFLVRNLPWHLDNYDQAKHAYSSYEMIGRGAWWFQHTPYQDSATKPPLSGWISAGLYQVTGSWRMSWILPSLLPALLILGALYREGERMRPGVGGMLASGAFALNLLTLRLATLVRTDMLLAGWIFAVGWMIYARLRDDRAWTRADQGMLFLLLAAGLLTKGPVVYAFLLPGLVAMGRRRAPIAGGAWPWLLSFALLLAWVAAGIRFFPGFLDDVVLREFGGRFTAGAEAVHRSKPVYYYLPHLLYRFLPWSVILIGLLCVRPVRTAIRERRDLRWLACWAAGGLLIMSLIPSKRVDRIFPILPPLALMLSALVAALPREQFTHPRLSRWTRFAVAGALLVYTVATALQVRANTRHDTGALVRFGQQARDWASAHKLRWGVVHAPNEGLLMYTGQIQFLPLMDAQSAWRAGTLDAVVIERSAAEEDPFTSGIRPVESAPAFDNRSAYVLVVRPERSASP